MDKKHIDKFETDFVSDADCIFSSITRDQFTKIIKGELKSKIKQNANSHEVPLFIIFNPFREN